MLGRSSRYGGESMILSLRLSQSANKFPTIQSSVMEITCLKDLETLPRFTDLVLNDVLEYFPLMDAGRAFKHLCQLLPKGSNLYLAGNDCSEVARHLHNRTLDLQTYNSLAFGGRQSAFSMATLKDMFQQMKINISLCNFGGMGNLEYYMIGTK